MNNEAPVIISASLRAKPSRLLAIWLLLIIFPAFLLSVITEQILNASENRLKITARLDLCREFQDFYENLSFARLLDTELNRFYLNHGFADTSLNAASLTMRLEKELSIGFGAIFSFDADRDEFSASIKNSLQSELGLVSRTMLKNLLIFHGQENRQQGAETALQTPAQQRTGNYLRSLLMSAGNLTLKPFKVVAALSGKPGLGRLLIFYCPIRSKTAVNSGIICVVRERDITVDRLIDFALRKILLPGFSRSIRYTKSDKETIKTLGKKMQKFYSNSDGRITLLGMPSTELLLRLITNGTLYPEKLEEVYSKMPLLQVTAPIITHPLRAFIAGARTPALILILLATMVILRIYFFGYGGNLRIGPRIFVSVIAASLLPFSTFLAAAAYHQHFVEEFATAEINQYIELQTDQINKSLNAHINSRELQLAELSKTLGELNFTEALAYLQNWLPDSAASLVVYSNGDQEKTLCLQTSEKLDQLEQDMKDMAFIAMQSCLKPVNREGKLQDEVLGMAKIKSKSFGMILETVGTLHNSITSNLGNLYTIFPVFSQGNRFSEPSALALIRFSTRNLLTEFFKAMPELMRDEIRGEYLVQNCFIPLNLPTELPPQDYYFHNPGFPVKEIKFPAEKTARTRSFASWSTDQTINAATYLQKLNCILIVKATKISGSTGLSAPTLPQVIAYFMLIVAAMVIFLGKILVEPISLLKAAAERVAAGDFSQAIEYKSGDEFEPLTEAFNQMSDGLLQKERMSSYVSTEVLQEIEANTGTSLLPGGERIEVSVLFCSLSGFKEFRSKESPEAVTAAIGKLIDTADTIATHHHGNIDKLIEDTLMLVFRQRGDDNAHVLSACHAAIDISRVFKNTDSNFNIRAGIASGPAVSGKIGSRHGKLDFTVIGNPVNLAARLKAQAGKAQQTGIIVCPHTIRLLKGAGKLAFIERTEIKGRSRTFPLYELLEIR